MYHDERMLITKSEYTEGTFNRVLVHCISIITSYFDLLFLKFTCPINNVNASSSFSCLYLPLFYASTLTLFSLSISLVKHQLMGWSHRKEKWMAMFY